MVDCCDVSPLLLSARDVVLFSNTTPQWVEERLQLSGRRLVIVDDGALSLTLCPNLSLLDAEARCLRSAVEREPNLQRWLARDLIPGVKCCARVLVRGFTGEMDFFWSRWCDGKMPDRGFETYAITEISFEICRWYS